MPTIPTDIDVNDFIRRYQSGETLKQLMAAFHIGHTKAKSILVSHGIELLSSGKRHRALNEEQIKEVIELYVSGKTTREIGDIFGVSKTTIRDYLRRANVPVRPRHYNLQTALDAMDPKELYLKRSSAQRKRWRALTPEQQKMLVRAAHKTWRGKHHSWDSKRKIALAKARRAESDSFYEQQIAQWLFERGIQFRQQTAIGYYNVDFTINDVAIEFTSGWAYKDVITKRWQERFKYIFDSGWHLYIIWHNTSLKSLPPLSSVVCDDLVAWCEFLQSSPSIDRQYRVVRGSGELISGGCANINDITAIFSPDSGLGNRS